MVRTISCDGSTGYDISPPIVVEEGDTVSFNPSGNVRLNGFTVETGHEPYIPNASAVTNLLDTVIATNGHYYLTADWSGLAHKPDGVVARVVNGDTGETLYFRGAMSPDTPAVDFDLLVLEPGVTVQVDDGNGGSDTAVLEIAVTTAPPLVVDLKITPSGTGGGMDITWVGEIGTTYQLQGSADLAIGKWEKIGETVLGTGGVITIPVNPVEDSYFYRIVTP